MANFPPELDVASLHVSYVPQRKKEIKFLDKIPFIGSVSVNGNSSNNELSSLSIRRPGLGSHNKVITLENITGLVGGTHTNELEIKLS